MINNPPLPTNKRLVFGAGINDIAGGSMITTPEGKKRICPYYQTWTSMLRRCYSANSIKSRPSYENTTVDPEWLLFSNFKKWMHQQDWVGKHLDKDLLVPGNKVYSPSTCIFVPAEVNAFLLSRDRDRGPWPIGVTKGPKSNTFNARINIDGKTKDLGSFPTPERAHQEWKIAKHRQALVLAGRQQDARVANALSTRFI